MAKLIAVTGQWYRETLNGILFHVVALDDINRTIEVQLIDGEISEYDFESWDEMSLIEIAAPEDWRSPFEISNDNWQEESEVFYPDRYASPLHTLEASNPIDFDDEYY